MSQARWKAVIQYRSATGDAEIVHAIDDLAELRNIVERGPNWNTIDKITITLHRDSAGAMRLEMAA